MYVFQLKQSASTTPPTFFESSSELGKPRTSDSRSPLFNDKPISTPLTSAQPTAAIYTTTSLALKTTLWAEQPFVDLINQHILSLAHPFNISLSNVSIAVPIHTGYTNGPPRSASTTAPCDVPGYKAGRAKAVWASPKRITSKRKADNTSTSRPSSKRSASIPLRPSDALSPPPSTRTSLTLTSIFRDDAETIHTINLAIFELAHPFSVTVSDLFVY
jgi:hypothetical protein